MAIHAILSGFIALLIGLVAYLANKLGKKSAQLEAAKAEKDKEEKEKAYAKTIADNISTMSDDDVRSKLHDIANKQR